MNVKKVETLRGFFFFLEWEQDHVKKKMTAIRRSTCEQN